MDALCAAVRSDVFKDIRPPGIRPRWRYLTSETVYEVLNDFADIFMHQNDPPAVEKIVKNESGRILSLGAPTGWHLCLRPADEIVLFPGYPNWDEYGGIPTGPYVLLGQGMRRLRPGVPCQELRWFFYLGPHGQIICHHETANALFVVGLSIDELARRGMINCEFLYLEQKLTKTTTVPARLVNELLSYDQRDGKNIAKCARLRQGRVILIHTPGEGDRPMALCGTEQCLRLWWPFSRMSDAHFKEFPARITRRIKSEWNYFAAVGLRISQEPYRVESVLVIDVNGAIFHVDPDFDIMWRIADSVHDLFCMGLTKVYMPRRRIDKGSVGRARLEAPGCGHVADAAWVEHYDIYGFRSYNDFKAQLKWLSREGRFDDSSGTWDETDKAIRKSFDKESKESMRRNIETADAMNDVEYTLRGCSRGMLNDSLTEFTTKCRVDNSDDD